MDPAWAYLSIGSNLGERLDNCCRAIQHLTADGTVKVLARSPFYESEPVDYLTQRWFLNAAMKIETGLAPHALLDKLKGIEQRMGRTPDKVRFGPRVLDLDIILYEDRILSCEHLVIPHPRMHKRRFVLQPICDIDPVVMHPILQHDVNTLLNQLGAYGQRLMPCSFDC
ncbi:MAG: 2-amino-4-hydroxy-6-hydroxymethyldihydropteridine diphosphokinase [Desulfatitalea sp.]|nr:2-amino-4-hydroxy-6-hydroxymethyldihydropteridine diphosphokinase [Desulfatitalea sp.]NNK02431.1 2-amino-4-hydroxy-6-hydroxymethyldihydropteridine diphosphokinase [Desulfatitalea sp.]